MIFCGQCGKRYADGVRTCGCEHLKVTKARTQIDDDEALISKLEAIEIGLSDAQIAIIDRFTVRVLGNLQELTPRQRQLAEAMLEEYGD